MLPAHWFLICGMGWDFLLPKALQKNKVKGRNECLVKKLRRSSDSINLRHMVFGISGKAPELTKAIHPWSVGFSVEDISAQMMACFQLRKGMSPQLYNIKVAGNL